MENLVRRTFDGRKIKYKDLDQQHLSNIIWFNKIFIGEEKSGFEKALIDLKFGGEVLPYRPHVDFKLECKILSKQGMLKESGEIYFRNELIGNRIPC